MTAGELSGKPDEMPRTTCHGLSYVWRGREGTGGDGTGGDGRGRDGRGCQYAKSLNVTENSTSSKGRKRLPPQKTKCRLYLSLLICELLFKKSSSALTLCEARIVSGFV